MQVVTRPRRTARAGRRPAYVALTKPRIIELLLVTTVPTMLLAEGGVPSLRLVAATLVGGALAAGSANTLNCYLDRDIDQVMHRTERRPLATGAGRARARRWSSASSSASWPVAWLAVTTGWLPAVLALAAIAFYVGRLHDGAQAPDPAEHRLGRRRRLHAGAHRLVGGHRLAVLDARRAVRGHLLLDPAALLAAVDAVPRRLRRRRGADAAGRRRQRHGRPADRRLQLGDGRDLAAAVAGRRHHAVLRRRRRCCSVPRSSARRTGCSAGPGPRPTAGRPWAPRRSRPVRCGCSTARSPT